MFQLWTKKGKREMAFQTIILDNIKSKGIKVGWRDNFDPKSRLIKVRISFTVLELFLKAKVNHELVGTNAPEDLEVVSVYSDSNHIYRDDHFWVVCRSDTFDPVAEGNLIPERDFTYWRKDIEQGC